MVTNVTGDPSPSGRTPTTNTTWTPQPDQHGDHHALRLRRRPHPDQPQQPPDTGPGSTVAAVLGTTGALRHKASCCCSQCSAAQPIGMGSQNVVRR
jgi:hypothetical protein